MIYISIELVKRFGVRSFKAQETEKGRDKLPALEV
jgi:hypothetical protein